LAVGTGQRTHPQGGRRRPASTLLVGLVVVEPNLRCRLTDRLDQAGLDVAGEAEDGISLAAALTGRPPGAVVVALEDAPGITAQIRSLRRRLRKVPIVAVLPTSDAAECRRAISAGADGAVLDGDLDLALGPTVVAVAAGQISFPHGLHGARRGPPLTARQRQVLGCMAIGLTNAQIADRLGLSESTVKSHLSSAFTRLGVASRAEAAALIRDRVGADRDELSTGSDATG
jgi:DNA-binding NarL/FixJ family response regulator